MEANNTEFTHDELIEALLSAQRGDTGDEYVTTEELADITKHSKKWVRHRLKPLKEQGLIQLGEKLKTSIDDRAIMVPAWRWIGERDDL